MLGQIAMAVLSAACMTDSNDAKREESSTQLAIAEKGAEKEIAIEKEKTKQQIIGGIFDFLNSYTKGKGQV